MTSEFETAMKNAAATITKYIEDAANLEVKTLFVDVGMTGSVDFSQARPAARTTIALDADNETVVPMRPNAAGVLEIDAAMFELHQQNVNTAIEYRARILNSLLNLLQGRR